MIGFLALALPVAVCTADVGASSTYASALPVVASDSLKAVFEGGQRWTDFYPAVNRRKEVWDRAWTNAKIPDSLAARVRNTGPWRVLVITEPGCSDSANSVPIIARLAEMFPGLDLRLINSTVGKPWMEAHRTPDGRTATPTVLLLDDAFRIRGCWVEQPKALQDFWLPIVARKETGPRFEEKMAWYVNDDGREILRELVEMLEGAKRGAPVCRPAPTLPSGYPHATEPIGTVRQIYDGALSPELAANTFRNIDRLFPTRRIPRSTRPRPLPPSPAPLTALTVTENATRYTLDQFLELNRVSALLVLHDGRIALERYRLGNTEQTRWMSMSVAKSVTSTLIGAAIKQGRLALSDQVVKHVPALAGSAYDGVTVRDVLMMASGVRWTETYTNPESDRRQLLEAQISQAPGSAMALMKRLPRAAEPGSRNTYSTGETQVAAEILRGAVGKPAADYLYERIWNRVGMEADAYWWLDSPNGVEIGGSGISATLRDYARFGQFILDDGVVDRDSVLPSGWVAEAASPKTLRGGQPLDYGYLWWPGTSADARRDRAFAGEGIHGQFLYVNPRARVVIVLWSARPNPTRGAVVDEWSFFDAVVKAQAPK